MATADLSALRELMGTAARQLPAFEKLDQADADRLTRLVRTAQEQQQQMIVEASEQALSHIPALLRGAVRKLLFS